MTPNIVLVSAALAGPAIQVPVVDQCHGSLGRL